MITVTRFSPLGILILAFIAIPAYLYTTAAIVFELGSEDAADSLPVGTPC